MGIIANNSKNSLLANAIYDTITGMATGTGTIIELRLEVDGLSGRISLPEGMSLVPGQYLTGSGSDAFEPLPVTIFPSQILAGEVIAAPPLPAAWTAGMKIRLRGPLGHGFRVPATARRLALASLDGSPTRLLPLIAPALAARAAVAVYARFNPRDLPEEVEVLPIDMLPEALSWADFLALEAPTTALSSIRERLALKPFQRPSCDTQVLVTTPMPCAGLAECGVCAISTVDGWKLACVDGPVFDFNQLEG
jgi:hypothetical protein